ncbi:MAG: branched-chain amino acid aminotransferase [Candidatus Dormibacteria bacterium]
MTTDFAIEAAPSLTSPDRRAAILASPGFGQSFSDHMVLMDWTRQRGWHDARLTAYGPLALLPGTQVFHNGQAIFEGLKAYQQAGGGVATFRPELNAARFAASAKRLCLPPLPVDEFLDAVDLLVRTDADWIPSDGEASLYVRPFMFASDIGLAVRPGEGVRFVVIASPSGPYFASGPKPISVWISEQYARAAPGGTGAAKFPGNYAGSLVAVREAYDNDCQQVVFLDVVHRRWVEELGGMNVFVAFADGTLVTPELTGTILQGVTRDSLITLAGDLGYNVVERKLEIDEWRDGVSTGKVTESFACGTAAVITPIKQLRWAGGATTLAAGADEIGPCAAALRSALLDIQYGRAPDPHGWLRQIDLSSG